MKKFITFLLFLLINNASAGILAFKADIDRMCKPNSALTSKKILLVLSKNKYKKNYQCDEVLMNLLKSCSEKVDCDLLISNFIEFNKYDSSSIIGE